MEPSKKTTSTPSGKRKVTIIKTISDSTGKGAFIDPPADMLEEVQRTGMWWNTPVVIEEIEIDE